MQWRTLKFDLFGSPRILSSSHPLSPSIPTGAKDPMPTSREVQSEAAAAAPVQHDVCGSSFCCFCVPTCCDEKFSDAANSKRSFEQTEFVICPLLLPLPPGDVFEQLGSQKKIVKPSAKKGCRPNRRQKKLHVQGQYVASALILLSRVSIRCIATQ